MSNLDARTKNAMSAAVANVRAPSGRIPAATGAHRAEKGSRASGFEELFRRMRDHVVSVSTDGGNSIKTRIPDAPRGLSPGTGGSASSGGRTMVRAEAAQMAAAGAPGPSPQPPPQAAADASPGGFVTEQGADTAQPGANGLQEIPPAVAQKAAFSAEGVSLEPIMAAVQESGESPVLSLAPRAGGQIPGAEPPGTGGRVDLPALDPSLVGVAEAEPAGQEPGTEQLHAVFGRNRAQVLRGSGFGDAAAFVKVGTAAPANEAFFSAALLEGGRAEEMLDPASGTVAGMSPDSAVPRVMLDQPATQAVNHPAGIVPERLIDQVVQGVRVAHQGEASEIVVRLKPDFLGRLSIRVLADKHGMHVEIRAESAIVRQVMQDNLADLQQRLMEKGLTFEQFGIFAETGSRQHREPAQPLVVSAIGREAEPEIVAGISAEPVPLALSGNIDYLA